MLLRLAGATLAMFTPDLPIEKQRVLDCLKQYKELTSREISSFLHIPSKITFQIMSELAAAGVVIIKENKSVTKYLQGRLKFSLASTDN